MKILITGASGLIGTSLQRALRADGHDLLRTTRDVAREPDEVEWDAESGFTSLEPLEGVDAIIHLAGESIAALRWTDEKKKAIRDSRVKGTRSVVDAIAKLKSRPKVFIAASAIGYYGERGDEILTEAAGAGEGFLPEVCAPCY
jgi:uncharacterized protein